MPRRVTITGNFISGLGRSSGGGSRRYGSGDTESAESGQSDARTAAAKGSAEEAIELSSLCREISVILGDAKQGGCDARGWTKGSRRQGSAVVGRHRTRGRFRRRRRTRDH